MLTQTANYLQMITTRCPNKDGKEISLANPFEIQF